MKTTSRSQILTLALLLLGVSPMLAGESAATTDRSAKLIASVAPTYPYLMRHAGATAEVTVSFVVNSRGIVTKASIVESTNFEFNDSALDAIRQWTFTPATRNGKAVEAIMQQTFTFNVRDKSKVQGTPRLAEKSDR